MEYRREIDGLRALAVVPVILFHAGFAAFAGGFVGVDVFFVISGYLITSIILAEKSSGTFSLLNFYERRARRILPALFLVMTLSIPFAWLWLLPAEMKEFAHSLIAVPLFSSNFLFWSESDYFATAAELKPLLHTWSLAVEEQFYLLYPIFLILGWQLLEQRSWTLMVPLALLSLGLAHWGSLHQPEAAFFLLPSRAWELLIGALIAFYLSRSDRAQLAQGAQQGLSMAGFGMILYSIYSYSKDTPYPGLYALVPTVGTALVILFATPRTMTGKVLGAPLLVGLGLISYSAYLWHQPLFALVRIQSPSDPGALLLICLTLLSLLLAYLTWRFVEQPFRRRGALHRRQVFAFAAIGSVVFIGLGLTAHVAGGNVWRFDQDQLQIIGNNKEQRRYVWNRMKLLVGKPFSPSACKILIIGDSYAGDLVNIMHEGAPLEQCSFSTHLVQARCGNLFVKTSFAGNIAPQDLPRCPKGPIYEDPTLRQRINEADEVWLASSWTPWEAELLGESVKNLDAAFGKKFLVIGRKTFGQIKMRQYLEIAPAERSAIYNTPEPQHGRINDTIRKSVPSHQFFDFLSFLCPTQKCRLFDENGKLISFDGTHLTSVGAAYLKPRLLNIPQFGRLLGPRMSHSAQHLPAEPSKAS